MVVAHGSGGLIESLAAFGVGWVELGVVLAVLAGLGVVLATRAPHPRRGGPVRWLAEGAGAVTGLPAWCAGGLAVLLAGLLVVMTGFFWDVAWHIGTGRDEFLLSPPHVALLTGISLIGAAGGVASWTATRDGAPVGWRLGRWRLPGGAAVMIAASAIAVAGFGVDELWHRAYGIDVTMWSPPHLLMIVPMSLSPLAGWLLLAEARRERGARRRLHGVLAGAALLGLSAYQLEFDLAVPQWPQPYAAILLALAGGFALTAARAALGPGGALATAGYFLALRGVMYAVTSGLWELGEPRFPLYLASAAGVEGVWWAARRRGWTPAATALASGAAVATLGLAGEAAWSHVWSWHPWQAGMAPWLLVAAAAAVGAAWLGAAFGRTLAHRPAHTSWPSAAVALGVLAVALAAPLPRGVPDAEATITTTEAAPGWVDVAVEVDPADTADGADRFEILSWQGGGSQVVDLEGVGAGHYASAAPVPVHGRWKSMVRLARGRELGGMPIYQPAEPTIGAREVPVVERRSGELVRDEAMMLREVHDGPAWPGVLGYVSLLAGTAVVVGLLAAGTARLARGHPPTHPGGEVAPRPRARPR